MSSREIRNSARAGRLANVSRPVRETITWACGAELERGVARRAARR